MSDWIPDLGQSEGFRYRALAEAIRCAVQNGDLKPGQKLLAHREMAWKLDLTVATVARAYQIAAEWGLISSRVGHGTRVRALGGGDDRGPVTLREQPVHFINFGILLATPLEESPLRKRAFTHTFSRIGTDITQRALSGYAPNLGYKAHRELAATWMNSLGEACTADDVVITSSAQEALLMILSAVSKHGDPVLVEEASYRGFAHLLRLRHHHMIPISMDSEGMLPGELQLRLKGSSARLVLVTPTLHSPTGATMSIERRKAIVEVARENDLLIVENDPFAALVSGARPPSLAELAPERTFHLLSLSKYVTPAIRLCFMRCPEKYVNMFEGIKHAVALGGAFLKAEIVAEWIRQDILKDLCEWQRAAIKRRWVIACGILRDVMPNDGKMAPFVLIDLPEPWRAGEFVCAARSISVSCIEADRFTLGRAAAPQAVRLALSSPLTDEEFQIGLKRLSNLLASPFAPTAAI